MNDSDIRFAQTLCTAVQQITGATMALALAATLLATLLQ